MKDKYIKQICFPNTAIDVEQSTFIVGINCDEIKSVFNNGEMANIEWFAIIKNNFTIAEIKASVCNVYGKEPQHLGT